MADLYHYFDNKKEDCAKSGKVFYNLHNNYTQLLFINEQLFTHLYNETTGFLLIYDKVNILLHSCKQVQMQLLSLHRLKEGKEYNNYKETLLEKTKRYNSEIALKLYHFARKQELWDIADVLLSIYQQSPVELEETTSDKLLKIA